MINLLGIVLIFLTIVTITRLKKPLYVALSAATLVTALYFRLPLGEFLGTVTKSATSKQTITFMFVLYILSYLQALLEDRNMLKKAEAAMTSLLNNRRLSLAIIPVIIGLLAAPGAVLMVASIMKDGTEDHMSKEEMAFLSSWYRHVPESSLPTFTAVLLAVSISGVPMHTLLMTMAPFFLCIMIIPYFLYLRRIPKDTGVVSGNSKMHDFKEICMNLWPIALVIILIIGFGMQTIHACLISTVALMLLGGYKVKETLIPMFRKAFRPSMLTGMFCVLIFKDVVASTGAVNGLSALFENLPIPIILIFAIIYFIGTMVSGAQTMASLILPAAMAALPHPATTMLLMSVGHVASQLCPTHICLPLVADYFKVDLGDIFKLTIPTAAIALVCAFTIYGMWMVIL